MQKIYLCDSGPKVSPAIYGFYRWKEEDLSYTQMESVIHLCLSLGINTFDSTTAAAPADQCRG